MITWLLENRRLERHEKLLEFPWTDTEHVKNMFLIPKHFRVGNKLLSLRVLADVGDSKIHEKSEVVPSYVVCRICLTNPLLNFCIRINC